jgi:hypothetical protein
MDDDTIILILSHAKDGRADDYLQWYLDHHLADVVAVPGIEWGVFTTATSADARWRHAALFGLSRPHQPVVEEIMRRVQDAWLMTDAIDRSVSVFMVATALGDRVPAPSTGDEGEAPVRFLVFSNPVEGGDADYDRWYDERHVPDVLAMPGLLAARRYALEAPRPYAAPPWRYAAIYEIDGDRHDAAMTALMERAGTERMTMSAALDRSSRYTATYAVEAMRQSPS